MAEEVWSDPTASVLGGDIGGFLSYPAADAALTVTPAPPPPAPPALMEDDEPIAAWSTDRWAPATRPANAPVRTSGRPAQRPGPTRSRPGPPARPGRPTDPRTASAQMKGAMRERRGSSGSGLLLFLILALVVAFVVLTSLG